FFIPNKTSHPIYYHTSFVLFFRERLIHLLALKPYKKPEIIDRLTREGLREKNGVTSVLKQVAFLKDNAYHLNRAMWNDVHENWPFYTESEKQTLKRRKPQNLTPPDSSDGGSSGSGHSPTSTHPGSPPPAITVPKRPSYYDSNDGLPRKRIRISRVPKFPDHSPYRSPSVENNNSQRRPITDSRDASNMNPRSRESPINDYSNPHVMTTNATTTPPPPSATSLLIPNHPSSNNNNHAYGMLNEKSQQQQRHYNNTHNHNNNSDDEDANATLLSSSSTIGNINSSTLSTSNTNLNANNNNSSKRPCDSLNGFKHGVSRNENNANSSTSSPSISSKNSSNNHSKDLIGMDMSCGKEPISEPALVVTSSGSGDRNGRGNERERTRWSQVTSSTQNHVTQVSPDSQSERISTTEPDPLTAEVHEYPDFLITYTTIKDCEQRRRYKSDFNADYDEYKRLHGVVEKVSRRFADLKGKLKQESASSPRYKDIRRQIVSEYKQNKQDPKHQQTKRRFQYLHDKLSHIKRLVLEYDHSHNSQY
ncbi:hypothetical protein AMK59_7726, partial [Oryctes borbonicus]